MHLRVRISNESIWLGFCGRDFCESLDGFKLWNWTLALVFSIELVNSLKESEKMHGQAAHHPYMEDLVGMGPDVELSRCSDLRNTSLHYVSLIP